jgi:hypothetical protein
MGNASRVFAVAQSVCRKWPEGEVHFFSWGAGYEFLERAIPAHKQGKMFLHRLEAYPWEKKSSVPGLRTLRMLAAYARAYSRNTSLLSLAVGALDPQVILLDSDYHFLAFLGRRGKLFFLGQAIDVVERARRLGYRPKKMAARLSFFCCEVLDGLIQRLVSDKVFVPSFLLQEDAETGGRALRVPLIVREEFRVAGSMVASRKTVAVTSGSGIESDRIDGLVAAIGGSLFVPQGADPFRITSPEDFQAGEFVVIQGGLTSISECIALNLRMLVVPIRGRAEQEVNARTVEQLGLGVSCDKDEWGSMQDASRFEQGAGRSRILVHGAEVVASHVFPEA